jgi:hypothetical protein
MPSSIRRQELQLTLSPAKTRDAWWSKFAITASVFHRGEVFAESLEGVGSTFVVRLPVRAYGSTR